MTRCNNGLIMIKALSEIIFKITQLDPETTPIDANSDYVKDLAMDSISLVSLVFMCEQEFDVKLSQHPKALENLTTVASTISFIEYLQVKA